MIDIHTLTKSFRNLHDWEIFREVIVDDQYGVKTNITLSGTVLDCGAHIGIFSWLALYNGCKVITVEPEPGNFEILCGNTPEASHFRNAITSQKNPHLLVDPQRNELHRLNETGLSVTPISLDELITEPISVLKMDIEGGEYDAMFNCTKLDMVEQITMECHLGREKEMIKFLQDKGFGLRHYSNSEFGPLQMTR